MRKVFPRPDIFGPQTELAIKKTVYITGPKFKSFDLVSHLHCSWWGVWVLIHWSRCTSLQSCRAVGSKPNSCCSVAWSCLAKLTQPFKYLLCENAFMALKYFKRECMIPPPPPLLSVWNVAWMVSSSWCLQWHSHSSPGDEMLSSFPALVCNQRAWSFARVKFVSSCLLTFIPLC